MNDFLDFIRAAAPWVAVGLAAAILAARGTARKKKHEKQDTNYGTAGMCLGMCLGTAIGTVLYAGDGRETKCFAVSISQSGVYPVAVEAYHAKGKIDIQLKENT